MKFNIQINQKAIIDNRLPIDLKDAAILNYIYDFANNGCMRSKEYQGNIFYWIGYKHLLDEMPLLGIKKKDSLYRRLMKMCKAELLIPYPFNSKECSSYYGFGKRYHLLIKGTHTELKPMGRDKNPEANGLLSCAPTDKNPPYNTIRNNTINYKCQNPTLKEVKEFCTEKGYSESLAVRAYEHYDYANWFDTRGKKVLNWKQKIVTVWLTEENKPISNVKKMVI